MRAGSAKQRIQIYRPATSQDDYFGNALTRSLVGTYWATVRRLGGGRSNEFEEVAFSRPYEIFLRGHIGIVEDDEIEFDSNVLVVRSVEVDLFKKKYTVVMATEKYKG